MNNLKAKCKKTMLTSLSQAPILREEVGDKPAMVLVILSRRLTGVRLKFEPLLVFGTWEKPCSGVAPHVSPCPGEGA